MNTALNTKAQQIVSVSQLTTQIRGCLETNFQYVAVVGEVSNFKSHSSPHWYFSLKDQNATLPCACFRQTNSRIRFELQDGLKVVARGRLEVYPPRGSYQLIITSLEPVGVGQWQLAFDQLKQKLEQEKLLDTARKRPIPKYPRTIGVVTSPAAAALRDILTALQRRNKGARIIVAPTRVQGEGSTLEIANAIQDLQQVPDLEVIIVARGGGSIEDLWSFNTEPVARAVANCRVPVISGVGHETDVTICDLVADLRAPTPTAAAELVCMGHEELAERWFTLTSLLLAKTGHKITRAQHALDRLHPRHAIARQQMRLQKVMQQVSTYAERLDRATLAQINQRQQVWQRLDERIQRISELQVSERKHKWQRLDERLKALSPLNVLTRGFAIIRRPDGSVIQDSASVRPGDTLEAWLRTGKLRIKVEECLDNWQSE